MTKKEREILQQLMQYLKSEKGIGSTMVSIDTVLSSIDKALSLNEPVTIEAFNNDGDEITVLNQLDLVCNIHIDDICKKLNWPVSRVSSALGLLEFKGKCERVSGMRFHRIS